MHMKIKIASIALCFFTTSVHSDIEKKYETSSKNTQLILSPELKRELRRVLFPDKKNPIKFKLYDGINPKILNKDFNIVCQVTGGSNEY